VSNDQKPTIPRRNFIQTAALGLGATVAAGATVAQAATPAAAKEGTAGASEDASAAPYDLIIVGAGTAGLPAAIQAADLGAKVALLDKNPAIGGMLHVTGSHLSAANTRMQIQKGFIDAPATHYRDIRKIGRYQNDSELVKLDVENAAAVVDWLQDLGVEFTPESPVIYYGHEVYGVPRTHMPLNGGRTVLEVFRKELEERIARGNVTLFTGVKAQSLIKAPGGRVVGVSCEQGGATREFRGGAVILTTGGYGANNDMRNQYNPGHKSAIYGGLPHATGDGIRMAQEAGAKLVHMDNIIPVPGILYDGKNRPTSMGSGRINLSWEKFRGSVWVNKNGERFVNEDGFGQDDKERALMRQPDMTFFVLFDEKARLANPCIVNGWSMDKFEAEAARGVIVKKANSIEALARSMGVDAAKLKDTIARYNASVSAGHDAEFGRDKLQFPVAQGPFYGLQTIGFFLLTMGGVKVNYRLEAEDENGQRIAGLFAAGEVLGNGQLAGDGLVGGMSVTPSYVFGRLSARYALDYVRGVLNRSSYT